MGSGATPLRERAIRRLPGVGRGGGREGGEERRMVRGRKEE